MSVFQKLGLSSKLKKQAPATKRVGVAMEPDGLCIALVDVSGEKPVIEYCDFVCDMTDKTKQQETLAAWCSAEQFRELPFSMVLSPDDYQLNLIDKPQVPSDELNEAAKWQVGELIGYPVDEAVIQLFEVFEEQGKNRDLIYAVSTQQENIQLFSDLAESYHLAIDSVGIVELALKNVTHFFPHNQHGVALLELNAHDGMLIIFKNQTMYMSRHFKLGYQDLMHGDEKMIETLVLEVQRSLDYFESRFGQGHIADLVIPLTDSAVVKTLEISKSYFTLSVQAYDMVELFDCKETNSFKVNYCMAAVGAAIQGAVCQ